MKIGKLKQLINKLPNNAELIIVNGTIPETHGAESTYEYATASIELVKPCNSEVCSFVDARVGTGGTRVLAITEAR